MTDALLTDSDRKEALSLVYAKAAAARAVYATSIPDQDRDSVDLRIQAPAQPRINKTGVRGLPLLLPPSGVLAAFDAQAGAATEKIFTNCRESRTLAALRDILLPKLMSGELRPL